MTVVEELLTWKRTLLPDGGIMLIHPGSSATIWIHSRRVPLRLPSALVASMRARVPALRLARVNAPTARFVTSDGEHGAMLSLQTESLYWAVALVAIDDSYVLFEGIAPDESITARVNRVAIELPLGTAARRVRMFRYLPPTGWCGVRRPLASCWIAPRSKATLLVCDAIPVNSSAERMATVLWPRLCGRSSRAIELGVLRGRVECGDNALEANLTDGRFTYRVLAREAASIEVIDDVLGSIEPVPQGTGGDAQQAGLALWMPQLA